MSGETILIVDDEPTIVEVVGLYLQREGFRVVTAADGAAALSMVEQQRPESLGALHKADVEKWWPIIKQAGIRPQE